MARRKLKHFEEMKKWVHVFEPAFGETSKLPGTWGARVILELGCGNGDYTVELAQRFSKKMVIGVDIKGSRLWHGAKKVGELELRNVRFLRVRIEDLADYFRQSEVDEIWLPFPDPHPTLGNVKRRLTSPRFLEIYRRLLKLRGFLHLKTDNEKLFRYTLEILPGEGFEVEEVMDDVYASRSDVKNFQTLYEKKYLNEGRTIRYLRARNLRH